MSETQSQGVPGSRSPIRRIDTAVAVPEDLRGCVVAIGNFDGVHRGHNAVLQAALDISAAREIPALVLTFEPHPRSVFRPEIPVYRLTPAPAKATILQALGFHGVIEQPFDRDFASYSADTFIDSILLDAIGADVVVTGFDFHFGKARQGSPEYLRSVGHTKGFGVELVSAFGDESGTIVSSTRIRTFLQEGDVVAAAGQLGYRHFIQAEIIKGKQLGRTLGYPTANMSLPLDCKLKAGIYAVRFRCADGSLHDGVASFGFRPTVTENGAPLLETYLFDFDRDLYGQLATVSLFGYLRGEEKFEDLDALVSQMKLDEEEARALLANVQPISPLDHELSFQSSQNGE